MRLLFTLLIILPLMLQAQRAALTEIRVPSTKFNDDDTALSITYPVVVLRDKLISGRINKAIKKELLDENIDDSTLNTDASLKQYAHDNLLSMSYSVLFNNNGILSIEVELGANGLYDYEFSRHFLFDLSNGKLLTLVDIIIPAKYEWFKKTILQRKKTELVKYERYIKAECQKEDISKDLYNNYIERANGCMEDVSLKEFSITPSFIEVHDGCFFPHHAAYAPFYHLKFDLRAGKNIMQPTIVNKLFGR